MVEDITPEQALAKKESVNTIDNVPKVTLKEFKDDDAVHLAVHGKRIYRLHACLTDLFPKNDTVFYHFLFEDVVSTNVDLLVLPLKRIGKKPHLRKRLLSFVCFLSSVNPYLITRHSRPMVFPRYALTLLRLSASRLQHSLGYLVPWQR